MISDLGLLIIWCKNVFDGKKTNKNFLVTWKDHLIVVAARLSDTCVAETVASKRFSDPATLTVYGKPCLLCFYSSKVYSVRSKLSSQ